MLVNASTIGTRPERTRRGQSADEEAVIPRSAATRDLLLAPRAADHPIGVASAARLLLLLSPRGAGARAPRARLHIGLAASKASSPRFARDDMLRLFVRALSVQCPALSAFNS